MEYSVAPLLSITSLIYPNLLTTSRITIRISTTKQHLRINTHGKTLSRVEHKWNGQSILNLHQHSRSQSTSFPTAAAIQRRRSAHAGQRRGHAKCNTSSARNPDPEIGIGQGTVAVRQRYHSCRSPASPARPSPGSVNLRTALPCPYRETWNTSYTQPPTLAPTPYNPPRHPLSANPFSYCSPSSASNIPSTAQHFDLQQNPTNRPPKRENSSWFLSPARYVSLRALKHPTRAYRNDGQ